MDRVALGVTLLDRPLLSDENVHRTLVQRIREQGHDLRSVWDLSLQGQPDHRVLEAATREGRVVLTHDADFGTLAVRNGLLRTGIIYLRPGHIDPEFALGMLRIGATVAVDRDVPFILVLERRGEEVKVRFRPVPLP